MQTSTNPRADALWSASLLPVMAAGSMAGRARLFHVGARCLVLRLHRNKPPGRPMAARTPDANGRKSAERWGVGHVFARQEGPMALVVHIIGIARAQVRIGLADLAYNMPRFVWLRSKAMPA